MARVSPTPRRTVFFRLMGWRSKRAYGKSSTPAGHSPTIHASRGPIRPSPGGAPQAHY